MTEQEYLELIESSVDAIGLRRTIDTLSRICHEKADHIDTNWQDHILSARWQKAGNILDGTALKIGVILGED